MHPHAALVVRQRAAPLDYDIDQLDTIPLPRAQRYSIATATVGTSTLTPTVVTDAFAPAQFTQMSADDRLVAPSFEQLHAGVSIGADAVAHGATVTGEDIETVNTDPLAPPDLPGLTQPFAAGADNPGMLSDPLFTLFWLKALSRRPWELLLADVRSKG